MKIEIENETTETIDWKKPQILISNDTNTIVFSNGHSSGETFEGFALDFGLYKNDSQFSSKWIKDRFKLYTGVLKLSNE